MKKHTIFIILIMGLALIIGVWRDHQDTHSAKQFSHGVILSVATLLPSPKKLGAFELIDMHGKPFTPMALKQHWSFLFFGYSSCPDVCPATLGSLHQISQHLKSIPMVQYVFISIDPHTDTPAQLKNFLKQENLKGTEFIGVTGKKEEIFDLAKTAGIAISQESIDAGKDIEHSGAILLINPQGELAAVFTTSDRPHAIAHDFKEILHHTANATL
jgi:protein SCO1/2